MASGAGSAGAGGVSGTAGVGGGTSKAGMGGTTAGVGGTSAGQAGASGVSGSGVGGKTGGSGGAATGGAGTSGTGGTAGISGKGGGAGVSGASGAAGLSGTSASGSGGSSGAGTGGGGGSGPTSWKQCTLPGTCVARESQFCCFDCDPSESEGAYWKLVPQHDIDVCTAHPGSCGGKCYPEAHTKGQSFHAVCENGTCGVVDVRKDVLSACTQDSDCLLRSSGCCDSCTPDLDHLIALAKTEVPSYLAQACNPEAPVSCSSCAPQVPAGASAVCNAGGHCEVVPPPSVCPVTPPTVGSPCAPISVVFCDYGDSPAVQCRDQFRCNGGSWVKQGPSAGCAGLVVEPGCPASCTAASTACSTEGAFCTGADGSVFTCSNGTWGCNATPADPCPKSPPQNGQACSQEALACQYGGCAEIDAARLLCTEGVWVDQWAYCLP